MTSAAAERVASLITDEVASVLESGAFAHWRGAKVFNEGDLIAIDNSSLYRDDVSTNKSTQYLAVDIGKDGRILPTPRIITGGRAGKAQFGHIPSQAVEQLTVIDLREAVKEELGRLGMIIFALVGTIEADQPAMVEINASNLKVLAYDPSASSLAEIDDDWIIVSDLDHAETLWRAIEETLAEGDFGPRLPEQLSKIFDQALHNLREQAARPVNLTPTERDTESVTILSQILDQMTRQTTEYAESLEHFRSNDRDVNSYNNLLRISYNFAEGAGDLLTLFVSICDLKPILYWATVAHQFSVVSAIDLLPMGVTSTRKASLKQYRKAVSGARNHAFHDFFAFARPLNVDLAGVDIGGRHLRLFREYGGNRSKSRAPGFDYDDRELIELLQNFTRAPERPVTTEFWDRNLGVMNAVKALTGRMSEVLLLTAPTSF